MSGHDFPQRFQQQVALRRAISLGLDIQREIRLGRRGEAMPAQAGIQPGTKIRLKGCGIKPLSSNTKGDLFVRITIRVPENLNAEQKQLIEELSRHGL